jgi:hypothetical protein
MFQIFELLTAEYLFDPQGQGELFTKDDDHMAQIIELLGDFSLEAKMGGKYSRELFDHTGLSCFFSIIVTSTHPQYQVLYDTFEHSNPGH